MTEAEVFITLCELQVGTQAGSNHGSHRGKLLMYRDG